MVEDHLVCCKRIVVISSNAYKVTMTYCKECPANYTHQDCNSSLVDSCHALNGNEDIANDESQTDSGYQTHF